ncbi:MAG: nucleotidyl transferase AbiEii/AbiGii toxin family protein [Euryarchaeota archaeon]|nr:nucleotidyl transferase AbiEii/AbiGii toxin family protein [Euryarchaeota archaeon]
MVIMNRIQETPELSECLALKGGTAIQGLIFGFTRLSVDIDMNYIGSIDKTVMEKERREISKVLLYLFEDMGYSIEQPRAMYAEEQFSAHFKNIGGGQDRLKLEINYLERVPVAGTKKGVINHRFEGLGDVKVLSYRPEELFAGKIRALMLRSTPRDLYDAAQISRSLGDIDKGLWRKISLFYLSMYDCDVRNLSTKRIDAVTSSDVRNNLQPLLSCHEKVDVNVLKGNVLPMVKELLDLSSNELDYFDQLYTEHRAEPDVLFEDIDMPDELARHPAIVWRLNQFKQRN